MLNGRFLLKLTPIDWYDEEIAESDLHYDKWYESLCEHMRHVFKEHLSIYSYKNKYGNNISIKYNELYDTDLHLMIDLDFNIDESIGISILDLELEKFTDEFITDFNDTLANMVASFKLPTLIDSAANQYVCNYIKDLQYEFLGIY